MWPKLTSLDSVERKSMLELYRCATSASFTTMDGPSHKKAQLQEGSVHWRPRLLEFPAATNNKDPSTCYECGTEKKGTTRVSPWKGVVRFGKRGKLNPRDAGPFKALARVEALAYKLSYLES
ncbi:hypothetical protein Tco_1440535 [Tanacetum coccineum]